MKINQLAKELNLTVPQIEAELPNINLDGDLTDDAIAQIRAKFSALSLPHSAPATSDAIAPPEKAPQKKAAPKEATATPLTCAELAQKWDLPETKIGQLINITSAAFKVPKQTKFDEHWVTLLEVTRQQVTATYGGNGTLQPNEFISWAHQQLLAASSEISSDINRQNDLEDSEAMGAIAEFVSDVSGEVSEFIGDVEWQTTEQLSDLIASRLDKSRLLRASFVKAALKLGASDRQQKPSAMKIFRSAATAAIAPKDYTADVVIAALNGRL